MSALNALRNYKSTGASGCQTELFKYALLPDDDPKCPLPQEADIARHLTRLLNIVVAQPDAHLVKCLMTGMLSLSHLS